MAVERSDFKTWPSEATIIAEGHPAGMAEAAVAQADPRHRHQFTWSRFHQADFAIAVERAVRKPVCFRPSLAAVAGENDFIAIVDIVPGLRRVAQLVGHRRRSPRIGKAAVGQFQNVARLSADIVDLLPFGPSLAMVGTPKGVIRHAPA